MAETPLLNGYLVLKGGTALRKAYFKNTRFSEDLDDSTQSALQPGGSRGKFDEVVRLMENKLQKRGPFPVRAEQLNLRNPHPRGRIAYLVRVLFPTTGSEDLVNDTTFVLQKTDCWQPGTAGFRINALKHCNIIPTAWLANQSGGCIR